MSFGIGVGDFIAVGQLSFKLYKKCKDSPGNYKELAVEVISLKGVIDETKELVEQQDLTHAQKTRLAACKQGCEMVLNDLDELLVKYQSLGTSSQRTFDRLGMATKDINEIRLRLISNVMMLEGFNTACSNSKLENKLNQLILEVRSGKRQGSVISTKSFKTSGQADLETWSSLRRELEDVGISSETISEKRTFIIEWFKEAVAAGRLEEEPPESERWSLSSVADDASILQGEASSIQSSHYLRKHESKSQQHTAVVYGDDEHSRTETVKKILSEMELEPVPQDPKKLAFEHLT